MCRAGTLENEKGHFSKLFILFYFLVVSYKYLKKQTKWEVEIEALQQVCSHIETLLQTAIHETASQPSSVLPFRPVSTEDTQKNSSFLNYKDSRTIP